VSGLQRFLEKWGKGGIQRSLERKRLRRASGLTKAPQRQPTKEVKKLVRARWTACTPLQTYSIPNPGNSRVTIVTDSVNAGSLYGGVGTALILAGLLCERNGRVLRVVTRTEPANPSNVGRILGTYGIALRHDPQFVFAPPLLAGSSVDIVDDELFITTSWWTTACMLGTVPQQAIVYLLQEDERMFYPHGDDRLRCEQIISRDDIRFVVNSKLLFDHLLATGLDNIARRGLFFEPAFPRSVFHRRAKTGKKRFMFYARPNNLRNLFYFGIEIIDRVLDEEIIDSQEWELILLGKDIPEMEFDSGIAITRLENLNWNEYAELAGTIDLAMCLMYTPHPSYPPLDLAASGAVVVTNEYLNKTDLSGYASNILTAQLEMQALVDAVRRGVALVANGPLREENERAARLGSEWRDALASVVDSLGR
jgi:hypothetical protein